MVKQIDQRSEKKAGAEGSDIVIEGRKIEAGDRQTSYTRDNN